MGVGHCVLFYVGRYGGVMQITSGTVDATDVVGAASTPKVDCRPFTPVHTCSPLEINAQKECWQVHVTLCSGCSFDLH